MHHPHESETKHSNGNNGITRSIWSAEVVNREGRGLPVGLLRKFVAIFVTANEKVKELSGCPRWRPQTSTDGVGKGVNGETKSTVWIAGVEIRRYQTFILRERLRFRC